jgi:hypothetical protein
MAKKTEHPPIYCMRRGNMLIPEYAQDAEMIERFPHGQRIRIDLRTGRSPDKLRFYWKLLKSLVDATGCAANVEALHGAVKLDLGYANPIRLKTGMTILVPGSIAFDKMTEEDFSEFLEKAIEWMATNFGLTVDDLLGDEERRRAS